MSLLSKVFKKDNQFTKRTITLFNCFSFTYFVKKRHKNVKIKNTIFKGGYKLCKNTSFNAKEKDGLIIGNNVSFGEGCQIISNTTKHPSIIGSNSTFGENCEISGGEFEIGEWAMFAPEVFLACANHGYEDINTPPRLQPAIFKKTTVGDNCWIGRRAIIVAGVNIGNHCVIGGGAVVVKDIPDYCVAVGNPARVVKKYNFETQQWEKVKH